MEEADRATDDSEGVRELQTPQPQGGSHAVITRSQQQAMREQQESEEADALGAATQLNLDEPGDQETVTQLNPTTDTESDEDSEFNFEEDVFEESRPVRVQLSQVQRRAAARERVSPKPAATPTLKEDQQSDVEIQNWRSTG